MDGKELFLMVEAISNEKNISKEDVLESLEEALAVATKKIILYRPRSSPKNEQLNLLFQSYQCPMLLDLILLLAQHYY